MSDIEYTRVGENEFRIHEDGRCVGEVFRHADILRPGVFVVHLVDDPRGFRRVRDPRHVRGTVRRMLDTHPLY